MSKTELVSVRSDNPELDDICAAINLLLDTVKRLKEQVEDLTRTVYDTRDDE